VQYYIDPPFYNNIEKLIIDGDDVKIIFEDNYQVNTESKDANNPMRYVVWHNYVEMADIVLASGYKPKLDDHHNTFFHGLRDDSNFMRSLYISLDSHPNYEPMLELLLKYDVVGQPTKEELKKAYEECYDKYALSIILAYSIDKNGTYGLKYENLTKNVLQKYCSEKNSTFSDVRTFIAWANEYKKADAIEDILFSNKKDKVIFKNNATQYTIKPYKELTSDEIKAIVKSR
jgi:putative ankyrin repeat protein (fragment)